MTIYNHNYITRISGKAHFLLTSLKQKTGISFVNIIDYSLGINSKFNDNLNEDINVIETKDLSNLSPTKPLMSKPSASLIDSFILICWHYYPDEIIKSRKDLFELVRIKFSSGFFPGYENISFPLIDKLTWSEIYAKWFKNNSFRQSNFHIYIDNRLKFLLSNGFIVRIDKGKYQLNVSFSDDEWQLIESITKLPPQDGLMIPYLLKSPKDKAWPLVYRDIFSDQSINEQEQ
ncbi:MAG: hypothetical protein MK330_06995 [SAR202 cluster bacterium]|nr:hypothetical protein [SAR202 cluster bacterium]|tara:strand:- start:95 stop:790 length:696 start_codon:yes stop_codon:yes gene_type:complete